MAPMIKRIKNGWAAVGEGWAVFGQSPDEAKAKFADAERRHAAICSRAVPNGPQPPSAQVETAARG